MIDALVAYFHYLAMMCLLAALVGEHLLLGGDPGSGRLRQLAATDRVYDAAVVLVLVTGVLRLTWFGKGIVFYTGNPLFHVKMTLFGVLVLLAVYQARQVARLCAAETASPPMRGIDRLKILVRVQMTLVVLIPALAVLMGRGFGY